MNKLLEITYITVIIPTFILLAFLFFPYCWNLVFGSVNERLKSTVITNGAFKRGNNMSQLLATELMKDCGYKDYKAFKMEVLAPAKKVCMGMGVSEEEHFKEESTLLGRVKVIDYRLSEFAYGLIVGVFCANQNK